MAIKQVKALKDFRYGTRMMRAGDVLDMDASHMRLFTALGAVGPLAAAKHTVPAMSTEDATVPAKPKAKRTKKRATAKK